MDINLSISAAPGITTDYLIVALYESSAPTALVDSQAFAAPHSAPRNINFTGLNAVPHLVIIYQNAAAIASGTIRHSFIYQPNFIDAQIRIDEFAKAGVTTGVVVGATSATDATLKDWDFGIERRGFGTMERGTDYSFDNSTGTWALLVSGDQLGDGEIFVFHFQPKITLVTPTVSQNAGMFFSDYVIKTADETLDNSFMGKCILLQGGGDHFTLTLPALSGVTNGKVMGFISEGGSHISASLLCGGSDVLNFMGSRTAVHLHQAEQIFLFKKNGVWNVMNPEGNFKAVGEIVDDYKQDQFNCLFADGSELDRVIYARVYEYMLSLDSAMVVSDTDWNNVALNNKGKWSSGDGVSTFRVPLLYAPGFLRGVNGVARKAGSYQVEDTHYIDMGGQDDGAPGNGNDPGTANGLRYNAGTAQFHDRTKGTETRPANTGIYKMIRC